MSIKYRPQNVRCGVDVCRLLISNGSEDYRLLSALEFSPLNQRQSSLLLAKSNNLQSPNAHAFCASWQPRLLLPCNK